MWWILRWIPCFLGLVTPHYPCLIHKTKAQNILSRAEIIKFGRGIRAWFPNIILYVKYMCLFQIIVQSFIVSLLHPTELAYLSSHPLALLHTISITNSFLSVLTRCVFLWVWAVSVPTLDHVSLTHETWFYFFNCLFSCSLYVCELSLALSPLSPLSPMIHLYFLFFS